MLALSAASSGHGGGALHVSAIRGSSGAARATCPASATPTIDATNPVAAIAREARIGSGAKRGRAGETRTTRSTPRAPPDRSLARTG